MSTTCKFIDYEALEQHLADCCNQYETSAPTVHAFCDGLYMRLTESKPILVQEIDAIGRLLENGIWEHPNHAANRIYHLQEELGQDITGQAGF